MTNRLQMATSTRSTASIEATSPTEPRMLKMRRSKPADQFNSLALVPGASHHQLTSSVRMSIDAPGSMHHASGWIVHGGESADGGRGRRDCGELRHGVVEYYATAQNPHRVLRQAYDAVLADHDLLLMPTTPMKAQPLPASGCPREEYMARALEMINNTCPTDASGHPAMSVPCGVIDGLPVGMMLVGRKFDEATVLRASDAFDTAGDWK